MKIYAIELSCGDPGYFVKGHVEASEFILAVNAEWEEEFEPEEAKYVYMTTTQPPRFAGNFDRPNWCPDGEFWWLCKEDDANAFPATYVTP